MCRSKPLHSAFKTAELFIIAAAFLLIMPHMLRAASEEAPVYQPIPAGTVITPQNWSQYKQYMTDGLQALFSGRFAWKIPADFQMIIGRGRHYSPPPAFVTNTEKYASLVKIVAIPPDRHTLTGYVAGLPFPNPQEPLKGWKMLMDAWYAYVPHITCTDDGKFVLVDRFGNSSATHWYLINRLFSHISDIGSPIQDPAGPGLFNVQMFDIMLPEQARYTASLTIYYDQLDRNEDTFVFIPALRRTLRLSSAARCSPQAGSDFAIDDTRQSTFNGNPTRFDATYVGDRGVIEMIQADLKMSADPEAFYQPIFYPKPEVGNWEVRDSYMVDVERVPSERAGYCYGRKRLYIDKEVYRSVWADIYDENMHLWKVDYDPTAMIDIPQEGHRWINNGWGVMIDVQNTHLTHVDFGPHGFWANQDCANVNGHNFTDAGQYSSVKGLSQIMR
jgi:hypothetical protein